MATLEQRIKDLEAEVKMLRGGQDVLGRLDEQGEKIAGNAIHLLRIYKLLEDAVGVSDPKLERDLKQETKI